MADRVWGHCQSCRYFGSPARQPLEDEEAACMQPTLSRYQLHVFGASGCNAFELRPGVTDEREQRGIMT